MRNILESIPLALAIFVIVSLFIRMDAVRCKYNRVAMVWMAMNALMMLIAQSSWWESVAAGSVTGQDFANHIWSIFNSSVMGNSLYIMWATTEDSK